MKELLSSKRLRASNREQDGRKEIESDYGRVIFSPAIRRMHDKTQVFPLTTDDNIHSRLTHSNEVMSIGFTLGLKVAEDKELLAKLGLGDISEVDAFRQIPVLMQNICLVHDIGNPPFGHFAETIIQEYFKRLIEVKNNPFNKLENFQKDDFIHFDGNAQGFRVLTKLQTIGDAYGLNLTYATLASTIKYPNTECPIKKKNADESPNKDYRLEDKKHGVFYSEKKYLEKIFEELELKNQEGKNIRHPFCYLMEAADSIAYRTMDIEDGYNKGLVTLEEIQETLINIKDKHKSIPNAILSTIELLDKENKNTPNYKIVTFRIKMIGYFVELAYSNFKKNIEFIIDGSYGKELIDDDELEVSTYLEQITINKIFTAREVNGMETTGASVIEGLFDFYIKFLFNENKDIRQRGQNLISKSIIECAMEENFPELFKIYENTHDNAPIGKIHEYIRLNEKEFNAELSKSEKATLTDNKYALINILKPKFEDLSIYYKFKVILDFITGMTDQYALSHFQMISGQKIGL